MMVSCLLMFSGVCANADDAMKLFGDVRTEDGEVGHTILFNTV